MSTLYSLTGEMAKLAALYESLEDDDERLELVERKFDKLAGSVDSKLIGLWRLIKAHEARAEMLKAEKKALDAQIKSEESAAEHWRAYVQKCVPEGQKWANPEGPEAFGWRKSTAVEIDDESKIPKLYVELKPFIKKSELGKDLKGGVEVPGARLVERQNLQVR